MGWQSRLGAHLLAFDLVHRGVTVSLASPARTISNREIPRLESLQILANEHRPPS